MNGANAIAVDSQGNAYVTGFTLSDDFPIKNAFQNTNAGGNVGFGSGLGNAFITKFNAAGELVYSTFLGGHGGTDFVGDVGTGIAVDMEGHAYVVGGTGSTDFPIKNAFQNSNRAAFNAFITKLASEGDALLYSTYLGGTGNYEVCFAHCGDWANGIAVDKHGHAYVTGYTQSLDFPTKNPLQKTNNAVLAGGIQTAFVSKLCPEGNALIFSTYLGGSVYEQGNSIAVDAGGNAYVTGGTGSPDFPVKNAFQDKNNNKTCIQNFGLVCNAFVTKLDPAGKALVYSTYLGGSGTFCDVNNFCYGDLGTSIALDPDEHAYVTGLTYSDDFPIKNAFQKRLRSPFGNAFVTKFDTSGRALVYSTYLGGCGNPREKLGDEGYGIAVDEHGAAYIAGYTTSTDFPVKNAFQPTRKSQFGNAFVTKLDSAGTALVYSTYLGGSGGSCQSPGFNCVPSDSGNGIAVDRSGDAYVTGSTNAANFPTKNAFQNKLKSSSGNAFVTKISAH